MATVKKIEGKGGTSYKITVSSGYTVDGRQKRYYKTWTPDPEMTQRQIEKELHRQAVLFEEECRAGSVASGNIKLEAFARQWFEEYASRCLKARTVDRYRQYSGRTFDALGHIRIDQITTRTVQRFILALGEDGVNESTGKRLAPKTIKGYLSFLSSIFEYARSQGMIRDNPCRGVTLPSAPPIERDCYTLEEAQQFLELLEREPLQWRVFFTLAIYGGFRRGELFGLEWQDVDFDSGVISIRRNSLYTKERGVYTDTPKTSRSVRSLKMPKEVIDLLREHRKEQALQRLSVGDRWQESGRLFVSWDGCPLNPNCTGNWLARFTAKTGMRKVSMHSFRHLNASLLINNGTDVRTVAAVLGHSQVSTTLNIYAHTFEAAQARATEAVASSLQLKKINTINAK